MRRFATIGLMLSAIVLSVLSGCATPESVIDLGTKTAESQKVTARAHLDALAAYRNSLTAFKADIRLLVEAMVKERQEVGSRSARLYKDSIMLKVSEVVGQFDEKAIPLLGETLDKKLEEVYWPRIVKKYEEYKATESSSKQKLATSPQNELARKNYRDYGIAAEFVTRLGYENEVKIRQEAFKAYTRIRQEVEAKVQAAIARQGTIQAAGTEGIRHSLEAVEEKIDAVIASIDSARVEMETALENEADAIGQINAYLTRPREWELMLQGISSEIKNVVGHYTNSLGETLVAKAGVPIKALSERMSSLDMDSLIDSKITRLTDAIDSKLTEYQTKTLSKSIEK